MGKNGQIGSALPLHLKVLRAQDGSRSGVPLRPFGSRPQNTARKIPFANFTCQNSVHLSALWSAAVFRLSRNAKRDGIIARVSKNEDARVCGHFMPHDSFIGRFIVGS